jgi:aminoglycoside phosphotransferase family enzyme/predicted kinase
MSPRVASSPQPPPLDWQDAAVVERVREALHARPFRKERRCPIALVQTHISSVFITPKFVFKFKRPLDVGFADFRSLRSRRHFCREELRLNRRLAPDVYLGVVALRSGKDGLTFGKSGRIVDYAVLMKRLRSDRMLDARLRAGKILPGEIDGVADVLARFHRSLRPTHRLSHYGELAAWTRNWRENFAQTGPEIGLTISAAVHGALQKQVFEFLRRYRARFRARVEGGYVRNGHGDLRCEHICLEEPIRIIDCVEFSERFRCGDVANDLAFLLMDLCAFGYPGLAARLLERYRERTDDRSMGVLIPFYACYRAFVRGKVLGMRLRDHNLAPAARGVLIDRARRFFALAETFARQMGPPVLLLVCGLMGAGKSTLAETLASRTGMVLISSDRIRKELAAESGRPPRDRSEFGAGIYTGAWTARTYGAMLARAEEALAAGASAILDASFSRRAQRRRAFALAGRLGAEPFLVECIAPDAVTLARLRSRVRKGTSLSDGRPELYFRQKSDFDPITEIPPGRHIRARTDLPASKVAAELASTPALRIPAPLFDLPLGEAG